MLEAVKIILIPFYIALFSIPNFWVKDGSKYIALIYVWVIVLFEVIMSCLYLFENMDKVSFYDDFIKVVEKTCRILII